MRPRLPDGRLIFLDPRAVVERREHYLVLADQVLADTGTRLARSRVNDADAVGALLDRRGIATLVPMPPGTRHFESPKILRADAGGVDVLWIDPDSAGGHGAQPARLMTARYDGAAWNPATTIVHVSSLHIAPQQTAEPVTIPDGIALAITEFGTRGLLAELLVERNGMWTRRPVASGYHPLYPFLLTLRSTSYLAFVGIDSANTLGLFVAQSRDNGVTWSSPHLVAPGSAFEPRLLALGEGLALVWVVGAHQDSGARGVRVAFSRDGTEWTTSAAFDPATDSTDSAMGTTLDDSTVALVRLIGGRSANGIESLDILTRSRHDVLWTKSLMSLASPFIITDGDDAVTVLASGVRRSAGSIAPDLTMWRGRVRCE